MAETDAGDLGPALGQGIEGRRHNKRSRTMDDDMTGYGYRRGRGGKPDADGDDDSGFSGQAGDVTQHPQVNHNGHRGDAKGQCVGCGSGKCMGGCGSGCRRM